MKEQVSFKSTPKELALYEFFLKEASVIGKSEYIKSLIERDKTRKEKKENEKNIY